MTSQQGLRQAKRWLKRINIPNARFKISIYDEYKKQFYMNCMKLLA